MNGFCKECGEDWGGKFDGAVCPACENAATVAARLRANELKSGIQEKIDFGGIKLVPEKTPKYYNPFGPKPGDQIYGIGEDGKPTLKTVDSYGNYTEYKNSGKHYDTITMDDLKPTETQKKVLADVVASWKAKKEALDNYTEYNEPGLAKLLPEKES